MFFCRQYELWKHLHVRGEDRSTFEYIITLLETPPRTWRRPSYFSLQFFCAGNTSTYVEKTSCSDISESELRKHLHVRGEDRKFAFRGKSLSETPPRTWRRPDHRYELSDKLETPPRTWRRLFPAVQSWRLVGNTSTYVEKTFILCGSP